MTLTTPIKGWLADQDQDKVLDAITAHQTNAPDRWSEMLRYANGDQGFALFLALADGWMTHRFMVSIFDLEDYLWHDAYTGGMSPAGAARGCLENDDLGSELLYERGMLGGE